MLLLVGNFATGVLNHVAVGGQLCYRGAAVGGQLCYRGAAVGGQLCYRGAAVGGQLCHRGAATLGLVLCDIGISKKDLHTTQ